MLLLTKPNSISAPAPKTALHVVARLLQLACTASTTVIFFHLLSAGIKAEVVVLLTFSLLAIIHCVGAGALAVWNRDFLAVAAGDLVCVCGFVTTAVMVRGVAAGYQCGGWLAGAIVDGSGDVLRRSSRRKPEECVMLQGVFGLVIAASGLMLVTFCLVVCRVREKRVAEALGMVEKRWREEEEMGGKF